MTAKEYQGELYRDTHPGYCLQNALLETGIDAEIGEWPMIVPAAQSIRDKNVVVVDEGEFTYECGEKCIVVYGNIDKKIDKDGLLLTHAVATDDISKYLDKNIYMVVFVDRVPDRCNSGTQ